MTHRIRVVGLCGGIGAGKSTVATLLAERGATMFHRRSWSFMDGLPEVGEPARGRAGVARLF